MRISLVVGFLVWTAISVPTSVLVGTFLARGQVPLAASTAGSAGAEHPFVEPAA